LHCCLVLDGVNRRTESEPIFKDACAPARDELNTQRESEIFTKHPAIDRLSRQRYSRAWEKSSSNFLCAIEIWGGASAGSVVRADRRRARRDVAGPHPWRGGALETPRHDAHS